MENSKQKQQLDINLDIEKFMRENRDVLYKRTSEEFGARQHEVRRDEVKTSDGGFTKHLHSSGMHKFNGLNTTLDKERVINGSKDWMLKLI